MPPSTNEQLCAAYRQGNRAALDTLIERNMAVVRTAAANLASQYHRPQLTNDLTQEGLLGLMRAAELYDTSRGTLFLTYADYWIKKYIKDCLNTAINAETVSLDEIEQIGETSAAALGYEQSPESRLLHKESIEELYYALATVSKRERAYLWFRFGFPAEPQNRTLRETAAHFHLSESRAKSTEAQALDNVLLELPWWYD